MAKSNIKTIIPCNIEKVWNVVTDVTQYDWRSDLSKTEVLSDKQFIEYTKNNFATTFTITKVIPYQRWEFDIENSNMKGHWIGLFMKKGNETEIDFTEVIETKHIIMKLFLKAYMKKQQKQFILDLKKTLQ